MHDLKTFRKAANATGIPYHINDNYSSDTYAHGETLPEKPIFTNTFIIEHMKYIAKLLLRCDFLSDRINYFFSCNSLKSFGHAQITRSQREMMHRFLEELGHEFVHKIYMDDIICSALVDVTSTSVWLTSLVNHVDPESTLYLRENTDDVNEQIQQYDCWLADIAAINADAATEWLRREWLQFVIDADYSDIIEDF